MIALGVDFCLCRVYLVLGKNAVNDDQNGEHHFGIFIIEVIDHITISPCEPFLGYFGNRGAIAKNGVFMRKCISLYRKGRTIDGVMLTEKCYLLDDLRGDIAVSDDLIGRREGEKLGLEQKDFIAGGIVNTEFFGE